MIDEGYIKYRCEWIKEDAIAEPSKGIAPSSITDLTAYRNALHQLNFIGQYPNGIGFGNLSQRQAIPSSFSAFIITGTQTGHLTTLTSSDYALVTHVNPDQNALTCHGLRQASSESLTHGVIYSAHPAINAIIHVHHPKMWQQLLQQVPTTRAHIPYGTPEMATETQRLFDESPLLQTKIFAMAGHEDGIVTFGSNLQMAYRVLINWAEITGALTPQASTSALQLPHQLSVAPLH
ncbi:MAG: rRNA adenine methyltransferase [Phormidesmis priestleyi]|uniref:rRNA adenine methyltransferase n=1 Tax=Phormidesmis priestleyi TaxID=268141 RepID=A0A2W4WMF3_9CYAN|nr:MAG: rRNA adenine methyltransferase [Phormidesmis priestleyi]